MRKPDFCICAKTKTQISCTVSAQLISAFVFAIRIVQFLYYLNPKFQAFSHLLWLYSPVCVGPGTEIIKLFSCSTQLSMKFKMLISTEIAKIDGIFRFSS